MRNMLVPPTLAIVAALLLGSCTPLAGGPVSTADGPVEFGDTVLLGSRSSGTGVEVTAADLRIGPHPGTDAIDRLDKLIKVDVTLDNTSDVEQMVSIGVNSFESGTGDGFIEIAAGDTNPLLGAIPLDRDLSPWIEIPAGESLTYTVDFPIWYADDRVRFVTKNYVNAPAVFVGEL